LPRGRTNRFGMFLLPMLFLQVGPSTAKWVINRAIVHLDYRRRMQATRFAAGWASRRQQTDTLDGAHRSTLPCLSEDCSCEG
jgi:hypothetical protein